MFVACPLVSSVRGSKPCMEWKISPMRSLRALLFAAGTVSLHVRPGSVCNSTGLLWRSIHLRSLALCRKAAILWLSIVGTDSNDLCTFLE